MLKLKNKNVLVYGMGKSGFAAANLLLKKRANVYLYDDDKFVLNNLKQTGEVDTRCEVLFRFDEQVLKLIDIIVLSPSVSIYHENIKKAQLQGVPIVAELELGFWFCKGKMLAITGTNGKTTTVKLVEHILKTAKKNALAVGNIGLPPSECALWERRPSVYVAEVSSFQMESASSFSPDIAAILNITPDHLDRHFTMQTYIKEKAKIFSGLKKDGIAILNADDEHTMSILDELSCDTYFYSTKKRVGRGTFLIGEDIVFKDEKKQEVLLKKSDITLIGDHNISNVLCAALVCKLFGIDKKYIQQGVSTFVAVAHRLSFVREKKGVRYFNDSKATNIDACLKAVQAFEEKVVLLLGGSDKCEDFDALFRLLPKNVKHIFVSGDNAQKILSSAKSCGVSQIEECNSLEEAIKKASRLAKRGEVVLLAPASASFDRFQNYAHRGREFERLVKEL